MYMLCYTQCLVFSWWSRLSSGSWLHPPVCVCTEYRNFTVVLANILYVLIPFLYSQLVLLLISNALAQCVVSSQRTWRALGPLQGHFKVTTFTRRFNTMALFLSYSPVITWLRLEFPPPPPAFKLGKTLLWEHYFLYLCNVTYDIWPLFKTPHVTMLLQEGDKKLRDEEICPGSRYSSVPKMKERASSFETYLHSY